MYCDDWHNTDCTSAEAGEVTIVISAGPTACDCCDLPWERKDVVWIDWTPRLRIFICDVVYPMRWSAWVARATRFRRPYQLESTYG